MSIRLVLLKPAPVSVAITCPRIVPGLGGALASWPDRGSDRSLLSEKQKAVAQRDESQENQESRLRSHGGPP